MRANIASTLTCVRCVRRVQLGQPTDLEIPRQLVVLIQLPALLVATYLLARHQTRALTQHPKEVGRNLRCVQGVDAKDVPVEQTGCNCNSLQ